jgi:hypothetical protein
MTIDTLDQIYKTQYSIDIYANELFKRAGGQIETIMHDAYKVSDMLLYSECFDRAVYKYTNKPRTKVDVKSTINYIK